MNLKISMRDLAHLREEGAIQAEKPGNVFFYAGRDVAGLQATKLVEGAGSAGWMTGTLERNYAGRRSGYVVGTGPLDHPRHRSKWRPDSCVKHV